ncbi:MAG: hypothetical protein EPN85_08380 [Bacteroidetes bacterium]|nr:MAG: hypothetical protein EPN85_08380 [Bacteroidota bacterium]
MRTVDSIRYTVDKEIQIKTAFLITLLFIVYCLLSTSGFSQNITATATLDTNAILIGQQTKLTLRVDYKTDQGNTKIDFPKIADTLLKEIEVVSQSKPECFIPDSSDMSIMAQSQTLIITSFDSGYYAIPPFKFIISGDSSITIETEPLLFAVNTIEIDTTVAIKDIKPPIEVPFSWKELLPYIYGGLAGVALLAGVIFLIIYLVKKQKKKPVPKIIVPVIPAHVIALEQLEKLKEEKLWQNGKYKEYHSILSDIIRQYIEKRFYINAMEQVSDEIMYAFRTIDLSEELRTKLRNILFLSDLVKFAKEVPLPNENEASWMNAYEFVIGTKEKTHDPAPTLPQGERVQDFVDNTKASE